MTYAQQIVATKGRHQIVILDGDGRDAIGVAPERYAVTTLGGAIIQRDLTHDEAQAWLARLWEGGGASIERAPPDDPAGQSPSLVRASPTRR